MCNADKRQRINSEDELDTILNPLPEKIRVNYAAWSRDQNRRDVGEIKELEIIAKAKAAIQSKLKAAYERGQIAENQTCLDMLNNYKPKPGELTSADFGSAGAGMETAGWKQHFEERLKQLTDKKEGRG